jgi:metal-sulfur cluster biosynthetic enzyme
MKCIGSADESSKHNNQTMTKEKILQSLKQINDPELGTNIVDLGLIYKIDVDNKKKTVKIVMTLTTPFCPFNNYLLEQVKKILKDLNFNKVDLQLSFDPPWNPSLMSPELKK